MTTIISVGKNSTTPSPFISLTKNPIRALHLALRASKESDAWLAVVDLVEADRKGFVQKCKSLTLRPNCPYSAGGEYLVYGEILPSAIIAVHPISKLESKLQAIGLADGESPFHLEVGIPPIHIFSFRAVILVSKHVSVICTLEKTSLHRPIADRGNDCQVLRNAEFLCTARPKIESMTKATTMSYGLGLTVGQWVQAFGIPPIFRSDAVWACVSVSDLFEDL